MYGKIRSRTARLAALAIAVAVGGIGMTIMAAPSSAATCNGYVGITFDDGPTPGATDVITFEHGEIVISAQTAADGTNYLALTLPAYTRFTDAGFESLSVQADPRGPVTQSLGQVTLNGELQMQGQLRLWSH